MNFEAFQAQQKAQKDEERMRKNQAAEGLRNHQAGGLSEEDTKATAMKEQERQHKLDAERLLRGYRGTLSEEDHKLAALREEERRKKLEAKEQLRGYGVVSGTQVPGSVSEMAGKFNGERMCYPESFLVNCILLSINKTHVFFNHQIRFLGFACQSELLSLLSNLMLKL
jgi:hypothetical protein